MHGKFFLLHNLTYMHVAYIISLAWPDHYFCVKLRAASYRYIVNNQRITGKCNYNNVRSANDCYFVKRNLVVATV